MSSSSSRRADLEKMRERLSQAFYDPDTKPADLSPLSRRLMEVDRDLEAINTAEAEDEEDVPTPDEEFNPEAI